MVEITRMTHAIAFALLILSWSSAAVAKSSTQGWHLAAGSAVNFRELELHVKGKALSVYEIVYSFHPMNNSGTFEPVGIWVYNYVEVGPTGHAENCKKWFNQVAHDESATRTEPYPYLEFDTQIGYNVIVSDEGTPVLPDSSVNCWEAMDFRLPL